VAFYLETLENGEVICSEHVGSISLDPCI